MLIVKRLTFTKTIELPYYLLFACAPSRCAPRKKRPTPRTHATLLMSSDLIGLNSARSHSADRSDADSNRQTPPAEWCPFGIASAPKAPISASTAVDAASMRTSYPRNHTDVVLGGAADSVVLSMLSRSTSRVRCSRALHSVALGCSRALHSVALGCSRALHSVVLGCSRALHSVVLGCSRALHVASGHSCLHTCAQWWSEREEGPRNH